MAADAARMVGAFDARLSERKSTRCGKVGAGAYRNVRELFP